jgi:hypothetical protein
MRILNKKFHFSKWLIIAVIVLAGGIAYFALGKNSDTTSSVSTTQTAKPAPVPTETNAEPTPPAPAPEAKIKYTYCVRAKGVSESYLPELSTKLASVYADPLGWSLGGEVSFTRVDSGCGLVVWLSAANLVPSFSEETCSADWSCTVKPNVIINFDRWEKGSDAWNSAGGKLDDYRTMVINHETGHWLGFNHRFCAGAGQLAPVMQQQSISLQGCKTNSWPLPYELTALKTSLGLQ